MIAMCNMPSAYKLNELVGPCNVPCVGDDQAARSGLDARPPDSSARNVILLKNLFVKTSMFLLY
jgi:hypothetical protein